MDLKEMKSKLMKLHKLKDDLDRLVSQVNDKTREIKYISTPSDIYIHIESLAEDNDIDVSYEVDQVRSAVNSLESAIYNLVEPFEDKARDAENDYDDLAWEIEDQEYAA